jgi:hypothetical protein
VQNSNRKSSMYKDNVRHNAETALINALALLRNGDTEQALTLTIVAVARIGSLVPNSILQKVGTDIGAQLSAVLGAAIG